MAPFHKPTIIDLTVEPVDRLTALPPELQHLIFDYLLPSHEPDIAFRDDCRPSKRRRHVLAKLAATCRSLYGQLNSWAEYWLRVQVSLVPNRRKSKTSSTVPVQICANPNTAAGLPTAESKNTRRQHALSHLSGRGGLLWGIERYCVFCGKRSVRSAILANGLRCCATCDQAQWPDKITKTKAKEEFDLKDHHLLPHLHFTSASLRKHSTGGKFPKIRYGTYLTSNVATTMFLTADVRRLAEMVHGDVEEHMQRRRDAAEERKRRKWLEVGDPRKEETLLMTMDMLLNRGAEQESEYMERKVRVLMWQAIVSPHDLIAKAISR
ncbi:hypothetical protein LTR53_005535 [Teratosphaeriaceae sp. CCFEE 6253]|nr:hypothetical protein LTR53_005535 [Teratosphaeriaceae sp. CCFEE 6253]